MSPFLTSFHEVIYLTRQEYWGIAWMLFNIGLLYSMPVLLGFPDDLMEPQYDSSSDY